MVLVLLGLTLLIIFMGNGLSNYMKENMSFNVMLNADVTDAQIGRIRKNLDAQPFVKSSRFISKEEAKEELIKELGDDPEELLGYNPALDCIEIFLHSAYANNDSIAVIDKVIRQDNNVTDLLFQQEAIDLINNNLSKVMTLLLILSAILLFISFTLIRNIIRLSVYSKRFLIRDKQHYYGYHRRFDCRRDYYGTDGLFQEGVRGDRSYCHFHGSDDHFCCGRTARCHHHHHCHGVCSEQVCENEIRSTLLHIKFIAYVSKKHRAEQKKFDYLWYCDHANYSWLSPYDGPIHHA